MEEEAEKLKQLQSEVDKQMNMGSPPGISKFTSIFYMKIKDKLYKIRYFIYKFILRIMLSFSHHTI